MNDATTNVSDAGRPLRTTSEIRSFFRTNTHPIFFMGPTAFNLLGIDRWVRNFSYLVYYDSWDGAHPLVFMARNKPFVEFESSEEIDNDLLRDPEVHYIDGIRSQYTSEKLPETPTVVPIGYVK